MEEHKNNSKLYRLSIFLLGGAVFTFIVLMCFLYWPIKVISPQIQPYKVSTKTVKIGTSMTYQVNACKYIEVRGTITRNFVDSKDVEFPGSTAFNAVSTGCHITAVTIPVPNYLPPETYHLKISVNYPFFNELRIVNYNYTTDTFKVIEATESANCK